MNYDAASSGGAANEFFTSHLEMTMSDEEERRVAHAHAESISERIMDQLIQLFVENNGRQPADEEMKQWVEALKQAAWDQERAKRTGRETASTVHISGLLVDINTGQVSVAKRARPIGLRIERESYPRCFQEGCPKRGSFQPAFGATRNTGACREHAPEGFVPEKVARGLFEASTGHQRVGRGGCESRKVSHFVSRKCAWEGCSKTPSFSEPKADKCVCDTDMCVCMYTYMYGYMDVYMCVYAHAQ